jgi:ribosomal protein L11 methyltransferase
MIRLAIRVPSAHAEAVLLELLELAPAGLEERELEGEVVEYAIYGAAGELPALPQLRASIGDALVELSSSEVGDDWPERWKEFHRAVLVEVPPAALAGSAGRARVPALHVRAPWLAGLDREDVREIVIDPGQAFGTGAHATTRLCLELLLALASGGERGPVLDVGTGSGVLAIAAALIGFEPVRALDNERASVDAARSNALRNGAAVEVSRVDLRTGLPASDTPPIVLANLVRPLLLDLAGALSAPPAHLLAGGLLAAEVDEVVDAYGARFSLRERARRQSGEWTAVWLSALPSP